MRILRIAAQSSSALHPKILLRNFYITLQGATYVKTSVPIYLGLSHHMTSCFQDHASPWHSTLECVHTPHTHTRGKHSNTLRLDNEEIERRVWCWCSRWKGSEVIFTWPTTCIGLYRGVYCKSIVNLSDTCLCVIWFCQHLSICPGYSVVISSCVHIFMSSSLCLHEYYLHEIWGIMLFCAELCQMYIIMVWKNYLKIYF